MIPISQARDEAADVLNSMRRLVRALRLFSMDAQARHNLSAAQLFVLQQLSATKPLSMKDLAKRTFTDQSSVSTVVGRLVEKGLVLKKNSDSDQRLLDLRLSAKGLHLLKGQPDAFQALVVKALMKMGTVERRGLKDGLEKLLVGSGLSGEKAEMFFLGEEP